MKNKISYFTGGLTDSDYSISDEGLTKRALILVEGEHIDSKKRKHYFSKDRINDIAENTNTYFNQGANIPLLADHNKTVNAALGNLESPVYVEYITEDNLPNKKAKHLLGKLGIFAEEIVVKSKDAIDKVANNIVNTISAGLDITTDTIREISLTPTPAILGMSLYKNAEFENTTALTFDDLDQEESDMSELEAMYEQLTNKLWQITKNIQTVDESYLDNVDPYELQMQALEEFTIRFMDIIGMNEEQEQENINEDPRLNINNAGNNPNTMNKNYGRYSRNNNTITVFSMSDMEKVKHDAEFGYRQAISSTMKAIRRRGSTGKTLGEIGSKFGRKMINATKGKIAGVGRLGRRVGQTIMGTSNPNNSKLSKNQMTRATRNIDKAGGRKLTKKGDAAPASNMITKRRQYYNNK